MVEKRKRSYVVVSNSSIIRLLRSGRYEDNDDEELCDGGA